MDWENNNRKNKYIITEDQPPPDTSKAARTKQGIRILVEVIAVIIVIVVVVKYSVDYFRGGLACARLNYILSIQAKFAVTNFESIFVDPAKHCRLFGDVMVCPNSNVFYFKWQVKWSILKLYQYICIVKMEYKSGISNIYIPEIVNQHIFRKKFHFQQFFVRTYFQSWTSITDWCFLDMIWSVQGSIVYVVF